MRQSIDDLGQLQRAAMEAVWDLGEANVHQVREKLTREKKLAYTTILTALQKLEKAGWLRHRRDGKSHVYIPTRSREEAGAKSVSKFLDRMFDGNAMVMFQHLIGDDRLSDTELGKLRRMIDEKRKERKQ